MKCEKPRRPLSKGILVDSNELWSGLPNPQQHRTHFGPSLRVCNSCSLRAYRSVPMVRGSQSTCRTRQSFVSITQPVPCVQAPRKLWFAKVKALEPKEDSMAISTTISMTPAPPSPPALNVKGPCARGTKYCLDFAHETLCASLRGALELLIAPHSFRPLRERGAASWNG